MKNTKPEKTPMNIMFLDIEGVLATHRVQFSKLEHGVLENFDPVSVDFLDTVCSKHLCHIIITSDKRKLFPELDWFRTNMVQAGGGSLSDFLFPDDELWRTTTATLECKALEIDDWFTAFNEKYGDRFYVDKYVIIDDNTIGSISMHDRKFVYVKDGYNGMGCVEYRKVLKVLNDDEEYC